HREQAYLVPEGAPELGQMDGEEGQHRPCFAVIRACRQVLISHGRMRARTRRSLSPLSSSVTWPRPPPQYRHGLGAIRSSPSQGQTSAPFESNDCDDNKRGSV